MTEALIDILRREGCSLVVADSGGGVRTFHGRGISDLYCLQNDSQGVLHGASVADKVVGKGAAALMILGGVREVYAGVISSSALGLLRKEGVAVSYGQEVPNIINRQGNGVCPVEQLCRESATAAGCLPLIEDFIKKQALSNDKKEA